MNDTSEINDDLKAKIIEAYIFASKEPVPLKKLEIYENNKESLYKIINNLKKKIFKIWH